MLLTMATTHPLHTEWKNLKNTHATQLKNAKLKFDKGLGPQLDIMASKPKTADASKAALKVHQYALDYAGNKYLLNAELDKETKEKFTTVLGKIRKAAEETPQVKK